MIENKGVYSTTSYKIKVLSNIPFIKNHQQETARDPWRIGEFVVFSLHEVITMSIGKRVPVSMTARRALLVAVSLEH